MTLNFVEREIGFSKPSRLIPSSPYVSLTNDASLMRMKDRL